MKENETNYTMYYNVVIKLKFTTENQISFRQNFP